MTSSPQNVVDRLHSRADFYVKEAREFLKPSGLHFTTDQILAYANLLAIVDLKGWLEWKLPAK